MEDKNRFFFFDSIIEKFRNTGLGISNSVDRIKEKIRNITDRLESSDNRFIRIIPRATKVALGILCIAALWYSYKRTTKYFEDINSNYDSSIEDSSINNTIVSTQESKELNFIDKYLNSLSLILELNERISYDNDNLLDDLNDKGEELNKTIEERAKYVSVELLNDKEFITFAKKNNMSDALKLVEEVNEKNKKGN